MCVGERQKEARLLGPYDPRTLQDVGSRAAQLETYQDYTHCKHSDSKLGGLVDYEARLVSKLKPRIEQLMAVVTAKSVEFELLKLYVRKLADPADLKQDILTRILKFIDPNDANSRLPFISPLPRPSADHRAKKKGDSH